MNFVSNFGVVVYVWFLELSERPKMLPKTMKSFFFLPSSFISDSVCGLRARRKDERMQQLLVFLAPKLLIVVSKKELISLSL
jgi:hypothetical protein